MTKTLTIIIVLLLTCQPRGTAQNLSKSGVVKINMRSTGAIIQNDQVKGYYMFYRVEKADSKNYNYLLSVSDENLRLIKEINFTRPRTYTLIEGAFNGEVFGFLFYDSKAKQVELISYDKTLKEAGSLLKTVNNKFLNATFKNISLGNEASQSYLIPVSNKGFLYYGLKSGTKMHYEINFLDNAMKSVWLDKVPDGVKHSVSIATEAFQSEKYIASVITIKRSSTSSDAITELQVQDAATGKVLFRSPMRTAEHSVLFTDVYYDSIKNNFSVFGEYFQKEDREFKARSQGFITLTYELDGKISNVITNSWVDLSKAAPVNDRGKFDGNNTYILFHNIIRTNEGKIFVIGEQYKKAASAVGILSAVVFGAHTGVSTVQLNVYNMVVFEFSPEYVIKKVHVFEKDKNVLQLPAGYGSLSPRLLSYYAKTVGGFDYVFSQLSADKSTFYVSYINYDREKGERSKNMLGMIVYSPEKVFTVDKLPMTRRSGDFFVYRAKEGYILISEYFKKEKKLESRLEKVNY